MAKSFEYLIKKIPVNIHNHTKSIITRRIAIFVPEEYVVNKRMHIEEYHFIACFTTPPRATIRSEEYQFKKGSLICLAPGDDILVHPPATSSPAKYMTICIQPDFMQEMYLKMGGKGYLTFKKLDTTFSHQLLEGIEALIQEVTIYEQTNSLMMESLENRIVLQLLRDSNSEFEVSSSTLEKRPESVQKAVKYIETYYSSNITIKDICNAIHTSPSHLQKIFFRHVGITPYQYIMDCRHKKAKEMLEIADISLEEITRQCGFVNNAHFSTVFKQREGTSPLAYRKSVREVGK